MNSPHIGGCTNAQPSNPATTRDIKGDLKRLDTNLNVAGIQTTTNDIDNIVTTTEVDADKVDTLQDSTGNYHITSGGGNDDIYTTRGGDNWVEGGTKMDNYYQFNSCLRTYPLACRPIQYPKTAPKAPPNATASCWRMRSGKKFTTNSIASCARRQGVSGQFSSQKWPENHQKSLLNQFVNTANSLKGKAA